MTLEEQVNSIELKDAIYASPSTKAGDAGERCQVWVAGPVEFIKQSKVGFFCSSRCPGSIVLKTFDAITKLRDEGQVLIGGFHSVMEWECLRILLRGRQPVIWVPARAIVGMRLKPELQPALKDGRLLILSPFAPTHANARVTALLAHKRNRFVGALADRIFVPHAAPASRTLEHCKELAAAEKKIMTMDDQVNDALLRLKGVERLS